LLFIVALTLTNCQVEEIATDENSIKTVSKEEAMLYLAQNTITSRSIKGKKQAETADLNNVTQEKITNSDQLLTVIPLSNNTSSRYSRILLIKIKDELKSVVFTMYPAQNYLTEDFTGKIIITNLEGNFINGFAVKEGLILAKLTQKNLKNTSSRTIIINGVEFDLGEELNEVLITNNYKSPGHLTLLTLFDSQFQGGAGDPTNGMNWGYENDGGGGSSPSIETKSDPCDELQKQILNTVYQAKIQALKNNTGLKNETGFVENKDGTYVDLKNSSNNSLDVSMDANIIGFNHTHIDDYDSGKKDAYGNPIIMQPIKIFSPKDVMTFLIMINYANSQNLSYSAIYGTVITTSSIYTLKFEGVISDLN
jgi:hypothetical protein